MQGNTEGKGYETSVAICAGLDLSGIAGYAQGGERSLMTALLFDGIQSFISYACAQTEHEKSQFKEAFQWILDKRSDYIFSFENVCESVGVNSEYLRCGLINAANSQSFEWKKVRRNF
ncbi:MAG: hypothetical protein SGJ02_12785 [bacterium]|nr:hypothetical protein [bacterium]